MNYELETPLLVSLVILIAVVGAVIWWYGVRKNGSTKSVRFQSPGYRDDLTLIDGIGATLQKKLNALGITSFKQIAELTDQDIARINKELSFKGRIEREGWVTQARKLVEAGSRSAAGTGRTAPDATESGGDTPAKKSTKKKAAKKKGKTRRRGKKTAKKGAKKAAKKSSKKTGKKTGTRKT